MKVSLLGIEIMTTIVHDVFLGGLMLWIVVGSGGVGGVLSCFFYVAFWVLLLFFVLVHGISNAAFVSLYPSLYADLCPCLCLYLDMFRDKMCDAMYRCVLVAAIETRRTAAITSSRRKQASLGPTASTYTSSEPLRYLFHPFCLIPMCPGRLGQHGRRHV